MAGFALAADAASDPAWYALWISIGSLAVSMVTVLVTVVLWRNDGWRLSVTVGPVHTDHKEPAMRAHITNVGRLPCVIRDISIRRQVKPRSPFRGTRLNPFRGPRLYRFRGPRLILLNVSPALPKTLAPTETVIVELRGMEVKRISGWFRVSVTSGNTLYSSVWTYPSEVGLPTQSAIPTRRPGIVHWRR